MTLLDLYLAAKRDRYTCDAEPPGKVKHWESDDKDHRKQSDGSWPVVGSAKDTFKKDKQNGQRNGFNKADNARQRRFEQTHKQTKTGNRNPLDNKELRRPPLDVVKDIPLKCHKGTLLKGQQIEHRVSIARGKGIDCVNVLCKKFNKPDIDKWSKEKGVAYVLKGKRIVLKEIHFYCYDRDEIFDAKEIK